MAAIASCSSGESEWMYSRWDDDEYFTSVEVEGQTVQITYLGVNRSCVGPDVWEVQYTPDEIAISLSNQWEIPEDEGCPANGVTITDTIELSEPIDGRPIVDGLDCDPPPPGERHPCAQGTETE